MKGYDLPISFYLSKRVSLCSRYRLSFTCFVLVGVVDDTLTKINFKYFNPIQDSAFWATLKILERPLLKICHIYLTTSKPGRVIHYVK